MADEIESLITDEHRAMIGVKSVTQTILIREEDARRVRDTVGDTDPRYADGTGIAPPYLLAILNQGTPRRLVLVLPNGILTQEEWQFHRPFRIGDELTSVAQLVDLRDRLGGRYGYSVIITTSVEFRDSAGTLVATVLMTGTQFDPKGLKKGEGE